MTKSQRLERNYNICKTFFKYSWEKHIETNSFLGGRVNLLYAQLHSLKVKGKSIHYTSKKTHTVSQNALKICVNQWNCTSSVTLQVENTFFLKQHTSRTL